MVGEWKAGKQLWLQGAEPSGSGYWWPEGDAPNGTGSETGMLRIWMYELADKSETIYQELNLPRVARTGSTTGMPSPMNDVDSRR